MAVEANFIEHEILQVTMFLFVERSEVGMRARKVPLLVDEGKTI